ncbi:hypothetical protein BY996DRAFT_6424193 [Phakopsora pachyrhizi]|nr:hypothetical protein BY996DRAFT_6424193 [Phakopsora pachyrhizi]
MTPTRVYLACSSNSHINRQSWGTSLINPVHLQGWKTGPRLGSSDLQTLQMDDWPWSTVVLTVRLSLLLLNGGEMGLWTFDLLKEEDYKANKVEDPIGIFKKGRPNTTICPM